MCYYQGFRLRRRSATSLEVFELRFLGELFMSVLLPTNTTNVVMRSSLCGFYATALRSVTHGASKGLKVDFALTGVQVRCFAAQQQRNRSKTDHPPPLKEEKDEFYVVRKGDIIGIYKSLSDCQAQVSLSVCDPSVSVYKGYALCKETEEYLASLGLKNPLYTVNAADVKKDLFDGLVPCPFKQPDDLPFLPDKASKKSSTLERLKDTMTCILEFDGASKGNPGKAGAGAILRYEDGSVISRVREGLGVATNNVAEYRALILGLKHALKKGIKNIRVLGDSNLVCFQMQDQWRAKKQNIAILCKEAKGLKGMFSSFSISHVKREFNSDADYQANLGVVLQVGEVSED